MENVWLLELHAIAIWKSKASQIQECLLFSILLSEGIDSNDYDKLYRKLLFLLWLLCRVLYVWDGNGSLVWQPLATSTQQKLWIISTLTRRTHHLKDQNFLIILWLLRSYSLHSPWSYKRADYLLPFIISNQTHSTFIWAIHSCPALCSNI